jgi:hypothetical protein
VDFDIIAQLLIRYTFDRYWKKECDFNGTERQLFINSEKAYDLVRGKILYKILVEFLYTYGNN